jgi:hypothetical protein
MSATTIQIPIDQVDAIRESLLGARREIEQDPMPPTESRSATMARGTSGRLEEIDRLLEQISLSEERGSEVRQLTGPRPALWDAVYDAVCAASERLAEECNEYWRGAVDPSEARALIADVGVRFELLVSLGPPPGPARQR